MQTAPKKDLKKLVGIFLGLIAGAGLLVGYWFYAGYKSMTTPWTDFCTEPISRESFTSRCDEDGIPLSATNILYARSDLAKGFAGAYLYRFDAPVKDCLSFAGHLIELNNRQVVDETHKVSTNLLRLATTPSAIDKNMLQSYGLSKIHWFEIEHIKTGFEGRGPPTGHGLFWIDTERGRFYYYWTD